MLPSCSIQSGRTQLRLPHLEVNLQLCEFQRKFLLDCIASCKCWLHQLEDQPTFIAMTRVAKNTLLPLSILSGKHNAINCHAVCKVCAAGIVKVTEEPTKTDLADLFTEPLSRLHRERLLACIVCGSFAHKEWLVGRKRKHLKDGAASQVSFCVKGEGTSWVGARHHEC